MIFKGSALSLGGSSTRLSSVGDGKEFFSLSVYLVRSEEKGLARGLFVKDQIINYIK